MNIKIQLIVAVITVIALVTIINMIRRKQLELRYALCWLIVGVSVLILDCFPPLISWFSKIVGIAAPVNMLFFFGFVFSLVIIFVLTVAVSRMSVKVKKIAQEFAVYKEKIENDEKDSENS